MRAIDADAFKDYITSACEDMKHLFNDGGAVAKLITESFCKDIDEQPTIQPKRGKWERHYSRPNVYADLFWHCSECGYKDIENYAPVYHHFCPNCGADMRGEQDG